MQMPLVSAVLLAIEAGSCARADTDALTFPPSGVVQADGYHNGGVGWSFVPKADLVVTWVGYKDDYNPTQGITGLRITFWGPRSTPLAGYLSDDFAASEERDTNHVVYGKILPLLLTAGTQYYVTSDLGTNPQVVEAFSSDLSQTDVPRFAAASDLTYQGIYEYDVGNGTLTLKSSSSSAASLLLGPTFRYALASELAPAAEY